MYLILTNFHEYLISRKFGSRISRFLDKKRTEAYLISQLCHFFNHAKTHKDQLHLQHVFMNCSSRLVTETKQTTSKLQ